MATSGTLVSLGDTAPTTDPWNLVAVEVRAAVPAAPVLDQRVSASATGASSVTSPAVTTTSAGEMVLALVSISGPHTAAQSATVTGAGLTWSRAAYADVANTGNGGTAEVWQAFASSVLSAATVTATGSLSGYDASITIATFSGAPAPSIGVEAGGASSTGAPTMSVTTSAANSVVWGVGYDRTSATSHTPAIGQSLASQLLDTTDGSTQWAQSTTGPVATKGTIVRFGDSAPTTDAWNMAVVEVRPGTVTLAADQSATTDAVTHSTVVSPSLTTTAANELIVAFVSLAGPVGSAQSVASVTGGGLTWTRAARSNTSSATYGGSAEVWQAYATSVLSGATVTATPTISGFDGSITVATFTGARSTLGATATSGAATGAPTTSLTTAANGSLVWGAGTDGTAATARTAITGQALVSQWLDTSGAATTWAQRVSAPVPTSGTVVSLGDSAPTADSFNLAAVEIVPATSGSATTYGYDTRGNRTSVTPPGGPAVALGYDQANRLTSYGTAATYAYNGDGLRMSKTVSGTTTQFSWDQSGDLLADGANSYIYGPGGVAIEQVDGSGNVTYLHQDQLGSTRLLTNSSGGVVATYTYDAYGSTMAKTGTASTPLGYAGQYTDPESGLIYLRARYYDPATGQFLSRDPAVSMTGEPYSYAVDNPLNRTDPSGALVVGTCGTFSVGFLIHFTTTGCVATDFSNVGLIGTVGAGGSTPTLSSTAGAFVSDAQSLADLAGLSVCVGLRRWRSGWGRARRRGECLCVHRLQGDQRFRGGRLW